MASTLVSHKLTERQVRGLQRLANHINTEIKKNSATLEEYAEGVKILISVAKILDNSPAWKNAVDRIGEMVGKQVEKSRALLRTEQGAQGYTPPPMKKEDMAAYC